MTDGDGAGAVGPVSAEQPVPPQQPVPSPPDESPADADGSAGVEVAPSEVGQDAAEAAVRGRPRTPAVGERERLQIEGERNEFRARQEEIRLRRQLGITLAVVLVVQLVIADGVFVWYGLANDWRIEAHAIEVWLGAAVVQVIGLVWIMVKYLFSPAAAPAGPGRRSGDGS